MNLSIQLRIDHYIGGPLSWSLNLLARLVAKVWRRDHSLSKPPRGILFMKFMGLGSIARSAFLLEAARSKYPQAKLYYVTFPRCKALPPLYLQIDDVYVIRDDSIVTFFLDLLKFIWWSRAQQIDLVIDLEVYSKFSSIISALSLARDRAGFASVTSRFRRGLYTHLVFWNPIYHVDTAYEQLGKSVGLAPRRHAVNPRIAASAREQVESLLRELNIEPHHKLLGVNPHSSELRLERRWPKENFACVISSLANCEEVRTVLLGSAAEYAYNESLLSLVKGERTRINNIAGKLPFESYLALLSRLSLLLTNDSAPLHLAEPFDIPTIALWGPTDPASLSPRGTKQLSLYEPIYCSPCTHTTDTPPCGGDNQCLKQIPWQMATRAVCNMLEIPLPKDCSEPTVDESASQANIVYGYWQKFSVSITNK